VAREKEALMVGAKEVPRGNKVPRFKSREEEADFWDSHSPLDFPDYWVEARRPLKFEEPLVHTLAVRLDARTIDTIADLGRSKGIGASTLARMWLLERLEEEQGKQPATKANRARSKTPTS
jgi:hypothetical protein